MHDHLDDAVDVPHDVRIPESQHAITLGFQLRSPLSILRGQFRMLAAIDLDDQSFLDAQKVYDVVLERRLAAKLLIPDLPFT
jgi:hypothetical protein